MKYNLFNLNFNILKHNFYYFLYYKHIINKIELI